jgi:hypothetical protein
MPKRWLEPRDSGSAIARWAVGCQDCKARACFTGGNSEGQARVWYRDHFCPEVARDDLAYLTLPRLGMTADELRHWAGLNASISGQWVLEHLGQGHKAKELT